MPDASDLAPLHRNDTVRFYQPIVFFFFAFSHLLISRSAVFCKGVVIRDEMDSTRYITDAGQLFCHDCVSKTINTAATPLVLHGRPKRGGFLIRSRIRELEEPAGLKRRIWKRSTCNARRLEELSYENPAGCIFPACSSRSLVALNLHPNSCGLIQRVALSMSTFSILDRFAGF